MLRRARDRLNATHLTFKKSRGETFSIAEADEESILKASKERTKNLADFIAEIIDIEKFGGPEEIIPKGMYHSVDEIGQRVESARRSQISRRWDWIIENRGIRDDSGKIKIKRRGKNPPASTASTPTREKSASRNKWTSCSHPR